MLGAQKSFHDIGIHDERKNRDFGRVRKGGAPLTGGTPSGFNP